jgi:hypothetical protein
MDYKQLNELEALSIEATGGRWEVCKDGDILAVSGDEHSWESFVVASTNLLGPTTEQQRIDARYIAAAAGAVPELIAEVRRLRAQRATVPLPA